MKETVTDMRNVLEACLDDSLFPSERLYKIWHCVFFLRYWKFWLMNHSIYKIDNFMTSNLYVSVEIIAHRLINLLVTKFRRESLPELFLVCLFLNQHCESFFRLARSTTTTESTVINYTMKQFLSKVRRVDMLHHTKSKLAGKLEFPREKGENLLGELTQQKLHSSH